MDFIHPDTSLYDGHDNRKTDEELYNSSYLIQKLDNHNDCSHGLIGSKSFNMHINNSIYPVLLDVYNINKFDPNNDEHQELNEIYNQSFEYKYLYAKDLPLLIDTHAIEYKVTSDTIPELNG